MCGILGGLFRDPTDSLVHTFRNALDKLEHRGPDDRGFEIINTSANQLLALGQTRLSILDLSSAGHQPMTSQDGRVSIIYNGEIYNYKELRQDLQKNGYNFTSETDTEVLLNAFHCWNIDCLDKLTGMFAFCAYDHTEQKIILARDAFGIKPLFYTFNDDHFIFSSEINPVLDLLGSEPKPDLQTAYDYLIHGDYDSTDHTFFDGIMHLRPASYIEYNCKTNKLSSPKKWWLPNIHQNPTISFEEAVHKVKQIFLSNVKLHLRSDVPIGAALSGGVDSSAIVGAMRYLEPEMPIHTFSYIAKGSNKSEEKWIDIVNHSIGAIEHKVIATPDELMSDLDDLIKSQGEPFGTTSIYAQYRVFKLAKEKGITVTLDGQGADELLAGYFGYPAERLLSLIEKLSFINAIKFATRWSRFPDRSFIGIWMLFGKKMLPSSLFRIARKILGKEFTPKWLVQDYLNQANVKIHERRMPLSPNARHRRVFEQLVFSLQSRPLPSLLRHGDRNSMRFSIESRVPFLTTDFADYLYQLPENFLINDNGETKSVFREAMKGIVSDEILSRKDKIGFETNSENWKSYYISTIKEELKDVTIFFINNNILITKLEFMSEREVWRILNYIKWFKQNFIN